MTKDIREKAEESLKNDDTLDELTTDQDLSQIIQELRVHQIELELQNEELRQAQHDLEATRQRYYDLYHFAPVGYFTFDAEGLLLEMNLAGAELLERERKFLHRRPLITHLTPESYKVFYSHLKETLAEPDAPHSCELMIRRPDGSLRCVQVKSRAKTDGAGQPVVHSAMMDITDRKQAEENLRESKKRYLILSELTVDYAYAVRIEPDNSIHSEWLIGSFTEITGYTEEEFFRRMSWGDLIHPADWPMLQQRIAQLLGGQSHQGQFRIVTKNGETRWLQDNARPEWDAAHKRVIRIYGAARDITEQKQAEDQLRYQASLLRNVSEAVISTDMEFKIQSWNRAAESIYGWRAEEVIGRPMAEVVRSEYIQPSREEIIKAVLEDGYWRGEVIQYHKDGRPLHILGSVAVVRNGWDKAVGLIGVNRDITDRVQMEEELRQYQDQLEQLVEQRTAELRTANQALSEEIAERKQMERMLLTTTARLQHLLTATPVIIYSAEPTDAYRPTSISENVEMQLGYKPAEFLHTPHFWLNGIHPEDKSRAQKGVERLLAQGHCVCEYRFRNQHGVYRWLRDESRLVHDSEGDLIEIVGYLLDITDQKQAEKTLLQLNEELERRVQERTHALENEITEHKRTEAALLEQTDELARSNAELEQFAYVASHDLQEPLRMIASYVKLLEQQYYGQLDPKADKFIGYIVDGALRMQMLINELLAYSRLSTRGQPFGQTDCEEIFNRVIANLRVAIEEEQAEITHDPLPTLVADAGQMSQVFQNLLSNALKFRREEPPRIHVSAARQEGDWLFSVRDNGIGMKPAQTERIFVIFKRLHSRSRYPGNGIGLSICKKIVERHGGQIWVESEPAQGSTFYFTIPDQEKNRHG